MTISAQKQDGLSCLIRTIDTKKAFDISHMFTDYSNNIFSHWWSRWFVKRKELNFTLFRNLYFLATKPTHATTHEFSRCQSKGNHQWIYHRPNGNCLDAHLEFGIVNNLNLKESLF